jgi:signal transduction histidine kinase
MRETVHGMKQHPGTWLIKAVAVLLWLLACGVPALAGTLYRLAPEATQIDVRAVLYLLDPDGTMSASEVASQPGAMKELARVRTPFTLSHPDRVVWLRFDVQAESPAPREWELEVGRAILDHVQVFTANEKGEWTGSVALGAAVPFAARPVPHRNFVFPLPVPPGAALPVLVRVQYAGPSVIHLALWRAEALAASQITTVAFFCLYFGLAGGMLIYVLLLNMVVRDRGYLIYAASVASAVIGVAGHSGVGAQFVWGSLAWWNSHAMLLGYSMAAVFSVALTRHFLKTRERVPSADVYLRISMGLLLAGGASAVLFPANVPALILLPLILIVAILRLSIAVLGVRRRWPGAAYFLAAWATFHVGVLVLLAQHFALLSDNTLTANFVEVGSALEMILLSLALADCINDARRKAERAQSAANELLEQRVAERTQALGEAQAELMATARRAGMAEIATNVLHNVGNTLNSVNVTAQLLHESVASSRAVGLSRVVALIETNGSDLAGFLSNDPRGRVLPAYLKELGEQLHRERDMLLNQLQELTDSVQHIKNVVATQQAYVGTSTFMELVKPGELIEDALRMAAIAEHYSKFKVVTEIEDVAALAMDKTRVVQVLVNLLTNAMQAMERSGTGEGILTVRLTTDGSMIRFIVSDTGSGIAPDDMRSLFSHGFTTRRNGHGFGLHSSAIAAREMGGVLTAHSDGVGSGATFTLELSLEPRS